MSGRGIRDMRSRTEQLKPTNAQRNGDLFEFVTASKTVAPEHCKVYNVAGFSLECENGGKRDWRAGTVVETLAQDWSQMDRETQHERGVGHQRTSTQLGRSCGQNGLQRNLCEALRCRTRTWCRSSENEHSVGPVLWPEWTTKKSVRRP